MDRPQHEPTDSPDGWIAICERQCRNIRGAYRGQISNDTKIDCALLATEAALKAIIWKKQEWKEYPGKNRGFKYLYNHNLDAMLDQTGLRDRIRADDKLWSSWRVLLNSAVKQHRYSPNTPTDDEANEVCFSARSVDEGIVPWLLKRYQEMT